MDTDTAQPNATPQPEQTDTNRTAGEPTQDAGITMTQAQIDAIIQSRLAEERRRTQTKYGDLDELLKLKQQADEQRQAEMTEMEKLQQQIQDMKAAQAELQRQADTERLNALRLRVGQEAGLPSLMSARLQGATEEELKADAEAIKGILGANGGIVPPNIDATSGGGQTAPRGLTAKLSPEQRQRGEFYVQRYGGTLEDYAKLLHQFEE